MLRPRARSRGRETCGAPSLGLRTTRPRNARRIGTATSCCPPFGPSRRSDAELTEWPAALGLRFAWAVEDAPDLPETPELLDAPEAEAGG
jgi:hypothetical protein